MSEMEKQELERIICAMSEEEMKIAVSKINTDMLWDELRKRETENRNIIHRVKDLVRE